MHGGLRGNPVLWPASLFRELAALQGDVGGRALLHRHKAQVLAVEMADDAVLVDVDEPEDLAALTAVPS
jgi:molybdenum cofactor cytidylyltransferase